MTLNSAGFLKLAIHFNTQVSHFYCYVLGKGSAKKVCLNVHQQSLQYCTCFNSVHNYHIARACPLHGLIVLHSVVKQRLQLYHSPYKGAFQCIRTVYQTEGIKAFYRSYTTQLSMNVPFQVVHFVMYESFQDRFNPTRHYNPLSHMLSGAGAGGVAAAITTPLDVAKTFLNTYEQRTGIGSDEKVRGMFKALVKIYQVSGFRGYFRGLSARVIYQVPSTALCWSVYELFKQILGLKQAELRSHNDQRPS